MQIWEVNFSNKKLDKSKFISYICCYKLLKLNDMKPQMLLKMRISVDSSQKQRYTEEEINLEFIKDNIKIERKLVVRKTDGAVMGEILV